MIPKITPTQIAYAFYKFIYKVCRIGGKLHESWNKLDEDAYQAVKTGIFEFKTETK